MRYAVILSVLAAFVCGCSKPEKNADFPKRASITGNPDEPEWVANGGTGFDDNMKTAVYGVGIVNNVAAAAIALKEAESRGRSDLAANLGIFITSIRERYMSSVANLADNKPAAEEQMVRATGKEFVAQHLRGAAVINRWHDQKTDTWCALVKMSLDSKALADRLRTAIKPIITEHFHDSPEAKDKLEQTLEQTLPQPVKTESAALPDGVKISLDSLSPDAEIAVGTNSINENISVYSVSLKKGSVVKPVTLTMPVQTSVNSADEISVIHIDWNSKKMERLASLLSEDKKSVTVTVSHFSDVVKSEPGIYAKYYFDHIGEGKSVGPLAVPYYSQANSGWCWAASAAMVDGKQKAWEIAAHFKKPLPDGLFKTSELVDILKKSAGTIEYKLFWFDRSLDGFIMHSLDNGNAVWVGLPYVGHAVVVVGYDAAGVYVHDPSGLMVEYAMGKAEQKKLVTARKLAAIHVTWSQWHTVAGAEVVSTIASNVGEKENRVSWNWMALNPGAWVYPNDAFALRGKGGALSVEATPKYFKDIITDEGTFGIHHYSVNPETKEVKPSYEVQFRWDGLAPGGTAFMHFDPMQKAVEIGTLCNNDRIEFLQPYVSNTSSSPQDFELSVFLDGNLLAKQGVHLEAFSAHRPVKVKGAEYKLDEKPLSIGDHKITFSVPNDSAEIGFTVAPEVVRGVKAMQKGADEVEITWEPNREAGLTYEVVRTAAPNKTGTKVLASVKTNKATVKMEPGSYYYSVWARHDGTGLRSQDANYTQLTEVKSGAVAIVVCEKIIERKKLENGVLNSKDLVEALTEFAILDDIPKTLKAGDAFTLTMKGDYADWAKSGRDFKVSGFLSWKGLASDAKEGHGCAYASKGGKLASVEKFTYNFRVDPSADEITIVMNGYCDLYGKSMEMLKYRFDVKRSSTGEKVWNLRDDSPEIKTDWPASLQCANGAVVKTKKGYPQNVPGTSLTDYSSIDESQEEKEGMEYGVSLASGKVNK